jgi:hypothetical protein
MANRLAQRLALLLFTLLLMPGAAHAQDPYADGEEAPDILKTLFDEVRLGVRVTTDVQRWSHTGPDALGGAVFLGDVTDNAIAPSAIALYGLEAGLAVRGLEVMGFAKINDGLRRDTGLRQQGGGEILPVEPRVTQFGVRVQYLTHRLADRLGVGLGVSYRLHSIGLDQVFEDELDGRQVFSGLSVRNDVFAFVPARYDFGPVVGLLRAGGSVHATHRTSYESTMPVFPEDVLLADPDQEPFQGRYTEGRPQTWFVDVGVEVAVWRQMPLQAVLHVERTHLQDVFTETFAGVNLRLGFPF